MRRRQLLTLAGATALAGCTASGEETRSYSSVRRRPSIGLEPIIEGLREPVDFQTARDDRLQYVADKYGKVFVYDETGRMDEPLFDVSDRLVELTSWEQGLLGFELHPDFETNGKCYVRYSSPPREGTPPRYSHTFVLSEFRVRNDLCRAIRGSERPILEIPQPGVNHNAGAIQFGPDGHLYVAVGTGSSGHGDRGVGHADDWYWANDGGNGQDVTENLLGSILRIDVDTRSDDRAYGVPGDNPLVGEAGLDEHYAWGFRNPYRMAFSAGELYVGDVGSGHVEEVNRVVKGGNYGWNVREGERCFSNRYPIAALAKLPGFEQVYPFCPDRTPDGEPLVEPIVAYPHRRHGEPFGRAVVGGFVYQNETVPAIEGEYVFADLMGAGSGLFTATPSEGESGLWPMSIIDVTSGPDISNRAILSLGRDDAGELYVLTTQFVEGSGVVYRIVPP